MPHTFERATGESVGNRPRVVNVALILLITAATASLLESAIRLIVLGSAAESLVAIPGVALGLIVRISLIDMIARRRNAARITYLVLAGLWTALILPGALLNGLDGRRVSLAAIPTLLLAASCTVASIVLLVLPESNAWFARPAPVLPDRPANATEGDWFYLEGSSARGPVAEPRLREMVRVGDLDSEVPVWTPGMQSWQQATIALGERSARD